MKSMLCSCLLSTTLTMVLGACWTSSKVRVAPGAEATTESAESRFLRVVTEGGSLYGLGRGCDEWVVTDTPEDNTHGALAVGRITTRHFDGEGYFSTFRYAVGREDGVLKAKIMSRGSRSPAPWSRANGIGAYCTGIVEIRTDPRGNDWILVGKEAPGTSRGPRARVSASVTAPWQREVAPPNDRGP